MITLAIGTKVFDRPTGQEATILDIQVDAGITCFLLSDSIPLSPDFPTRWRHDAEVISVAERAKLAAADRAANEAVMASEPDNGDRFW